MANAASEGSGVRNTRTGTNARGTGGRWSGLSEWSDRNLAAATTISEPQRWSFGGQNATTGDTTQAGSYTSPEYSGAVYSGLTADQYKRQAADIGPSTGGYYLGQPNEAQDERIAEKAAKKLRAENRTGRKNAIAEPRWNPDVERMTWKDYNNLNPRQRAAIDFNTMLVRAVKRDMKLQEEYSPDETQRKTYDASLEKMFGGPNRGSEDYAPETVALLRQIDYQDNSADLDDFLSLKSAITEKDINALPTVKGVPQAVAYSGQSAARTEELGDKRLLAASTAEMEKELAQTQMMLTNMGQVAAKARNYDVSQKLGGVATTIPEIAGYQQPQYDPKTGQPKDMNTFFIDAFTALSKPTDDAKRASLLKLIDDRTTPEQSDAFWNYVDARSRYAMQYKQPLGKAKDSTTGKPIEYYTPEQLRNLLGLTGRGQPTPAGVAPPAPAQPAPASPGRPGGETNGPAY